MKATVLGKRSGGTVWFKGVVSAQGCVWIGVSGDMGWNVWSGCTCDACLACFVDVAADARF